MDNAHSIMSSSGVFGPGEFATILAVYKEIAAEPWFTRSPTKQQDFARHILNVYRSGAQSVEQFRLVCLAAAKVNFSECLDSRSVMDPEPLAAC